MILEANNLVKIYNNIKFNSIKVVDGINFKLDSKELVGIMGASGSGKSTTLKLISGISKATEGSIKIDGKELNLMKDEELSQFRRKKLGFVFQDFNMMDSLSVKENIILPMILEDKSVGDMEKKLEELGELFGIKDLYDKYPAQISGGQLQRVAICRALVNNPILILADEPTGSLDSKSSNNVMKCFEKLVDEKNTAVLMVTHDPFAASFCNRILFIKDGKISSEIVRKKSRKEFFDSILGKIAKLEGDFNEF